FLSLLPHPPICPLFPYTTLFRSRVIRLALPNTPGTLAIQAAGAPVEERIRPDGKEVQVRGDNRETGLIMSAFLQRVDFVPSAIRSEEHTSELQSRGHLVCRLLLE